jgi:TetR/AcrR family transcriptional regulator, tetracycline repressor protein
MAGDTNRGRRTGLSAEAIVALAIRLADKDGLEALTMRRLATELAVTPMALYWHFRDKNALIEAMAEHAIEGIVIVDAADAPWQDRLRAALESTLTVLAAHPWLTTMRRRMIPTPNYLRTIETLLDIMRTAGYNDRQAVIALDLVLDNIAQIAGRDHASSTSPTDDSVEAARTQLHALDAAGYPRIAAAAEPLTTPDDPTAADLVIDVLIRGLAANAPPPGST